MLDESLILSVRWAPFVGVDLDGHYYTKSLRHHKADRMPGILENHGVSNGASIEDRGILLGFWQNDYGMNADILLNEDHPDTPRLLKAAANGTLFVSGGYEKAYTAVTDGGEITDLALSEISFIDITKDSVPKHMNSIAVPYMFRDQLNSEDSILIKSVRQSEDTVMTCTRYSDNTKCRTAFGI